MKKIFITAVLIGIIGITAIAAGMVKSGTNKNRARRDTTNVANRGEATVAVNFFNAFVRLQEDADIDKWIASQPLTDKFIEIYNNQIKAVMISEEALQGKELSTEEKKFVEKYSVDFAPIFEAAWLELYDTSVFKVKLYDPKTGNIILRDEKTGIELPVRIVRTNGKWLIDGAGTVNMDN